MPSENEPLNAPDGNWAIAEPTPELDTHSSTPVSEPQELLFRRLDQISLITVRKYVIERARMEFLRQVEWLVSSRQEVAINCGNFWRKEMCPCVSFQFAVKQVKVCPNGAESNEIDRWWWEGMALLERCGLAVYLREDIVQTSSVEKPPNWRLNYCINKLGSVTAEELSKADNVKRATLELRSSSDESSVRWQLQEWLNQLDDSEIRRRVEGVSSAEACLWIAEPLREKFILDAVEHQIAEIMRWLQRELQEAGGGSRSKSLPAST